MNKKDTIFYASLILTTIFGFVAYASGFMLVFYNTPHAKEFAMLNALFAIASFVGCLLMAVLGDNHI